MKKYKHHVVDKILTAVVSFFALLFIFPFYWMITGAFKTRIAIISIPPQWFPIDITFDNFKLLFSYSAGRWMFNSVFVSGVTAFLICTVSTMAGYSLSKKRFPGRNVIFGLFVMLLAIPKNTALVPLFILMRDMKLVDTYTGLILPLVGWPFGIFMMKQLIQTMPTELLEAARIDGCSELITFFSVVLPIVKAGIAALAIFAFRYSWNSYFWQLIVTKSTTMKTLPLGIAGLQDEFSIDYGLLMAGSALASLPIIIIFFVFQKYFTKGITMGAVKG